MASGLERVESFGSTRAKSTKTRVPSCKPQLCCGMYLQGEHAGGNPNSFKHQLWTNSCKSSCSRSRFDGVTSYQHDYIKHPNRPRHPLRCIVDRGHAEGSGIPGQCFLGSTEDLEAQLLRLPTLTVGLRTNRSREFQRKFARDLIDIEGLWYGKILGYWHAGQSFGAKAHVPSATCFWLLPASMQTCWR